MAPLRKKINVAAVSRETPENTRNSQSQNTLDPGMPQEYVCQVSEEIEGGDYTTLQRNEPDVVKLKVYILKVLMFCRVREAISARDFALLALFLKLRDYKLC